MYTYCHKNHICNIFLIKLQLDVDEDLHHDYTPLIHPCNLYGKLGFPVFLFFFGSKTLMVGSRHNRLIVSVLECVPTIYVLSKKRRKKINCNVQSH